jgi:hypothetical protein
VIDLNRGESLAVRDLNKHTSVPFRPLPFVPAMISTVRQITIVNIMDLGRTDSKGAARLANIRICDLWWEAAAPDGKDGSRVVPATASGVQSNFTLNSSGRDGPASTGHQLRITIHWVLFDFASLCNNL